MSPRVHDLRWWHAALLGAVVAAIAIGAFAYRGHQLGSVDGEPYVEGSPTSGALEVMLVQGDGQAFAALAEDPTLARPERFRGSAAELPVGAEAAYRAQRPAFGYLAWMLSLGRPSLVPEALALLSVASASLLVTAVALLLADRGYAEPMRAVVVLALPVSLAALSWLGPELAALGLATLGVRCWPARRWTAVGLFVAASLFRETALVIPAGLALHQLLLLRDVRGTLQLATSAVPLALWIGLVHQRLGYFPWDAGAGRGGLPIAGAVEAASRWSVGDVAMVVLTLAFAVVAVRHRRDPLAAVVLVTLALGMVLGADVWKDWRDIGRVLLPVSVYGLVLLVAPAEVPARTDEVRAPVPRR